MKFYSTKNRNTRFSLAEAVLKSLPDDKGLFMPESIPTLPLDFFKRLSTLSFQDIASEISRAFLDGDIPEDVLDNIARESVNFPAPLISLKPGTSVLELFHGPTLAFKDVGARFMARTMAWLNRNEDRKLTILVATSGDTGGAVANGFYKVNGIEVIILYPSGKVSALQEKQLTTLGENISALEIMGTFDDCQRLVKTAFPDESLRSKYRLCSANSINIARLIPQSFYYVEAFKQAGNDRPVVFSVPSGNFGNLTAGLFAWKMGMPVKKFIASNNRNDSVFRFLRTGEFDVKETVPTISNAMDVGNPSNFVRMLDLFHDSRDEMSAMISAYSFSDEETRLTMRKVFELYNYVMDPHGAVGYSGWEEFQKENKEDLHGIILETAHPAKFLEVVEETLSQSVEIPGALSSLRNVKGSSIRLGTDYDGFHDFLMNRV